MKTLQYFSILILILSSSCLSLFERDKDTLIEPEFMQDENGVILKQPPIWRTQFTDEPGGNWASVTCPAYTNSISMAACERGGEYGTGQPTFYGLDVETGSIVWQTTEIYEFMITAGFMIDESFIFLNGSNVSNLDINTGELRYTMDLDGRLEYFVVGKNDKFYFADISINNTNKYDIRSAWEGDVINGEIHEIYLPTLKNLPTDTSFLYNIAGGVNKIVPFTAQDGTNYLALFYYSKIIPQGVYYLALYNEDTKEVEFDIKLPNEYGFDAMPVIENEKLFVTAAYHIYCMDIFTQEMIWEKKTDFRYCGLTIYHGVMLTSRWEIDSDLVAYNAETGAVLWTVKVFDRGSKFQVYNDIIYYTEKYLYAIDLKTGEMYWNMPCPDVVLDREAYFRNHCVVIPGVDGQKGKIIANAGMSTFCYEAIR